jgi:protein tyrosine phosphatase (PTP) superfamily phosphohydrolase (DUF442 family)
MILPLIWATSASRADEANDAPFVSFHQVGGRLYCGSQPAGPAAFERLGRMGIKVIVSVDGATPDVKEAKARGLRYVHLPIGYDGVPGEVMASLAELLKQTKEPVFIHCHHGKHRGPAAAAIAGMIDGALDAKSAEELLRQCGTGPDYSGLWRDVRAFTGVPQGARALPLREISEVTPFATAMVSIDHAFDELSLLVKSGFLDQQARISPEVVENGTLLLEGIREASRHCRSMEQAEEMAKSFATTEKLAVRLLDLARTQQPEAAKKEIEMIRQDCRQCHRRYRDN